MGIKPSVGLTSRYLVVPISEHQDTVGPLARTVKDAAYILQAIAGPDPNDNYTSAIPGPLPDYVAACNNNSLAGKRFGVPDNVITGYSDNTTVATVAAFELAVKQIEAAGATVIRNTNFTRFDEFNYSNASTIVLDADFVSDLPDLYLSKLTYNPQNIHDLEDLENFTHTFPLEDYPERDTDVWDQALSFGFNNSSPQFWAAYQENLENGGPGGVTGALYTYELDALLLPTAFSPGVPAVIGSPVVTVPMGFMPPNTTVTTTDFGLVETAPNIPFGLSFLGERFSEAELIGYAYAYEQRTMHRNQVQPYIVPTTELGDVTAPSKMRIRSSL